MSTPSVEVLDLTGSWDLFRHKDSTTIPASVPGCVHMDLTSAGLLPSLEWRDNEALMQSLDGETWTYRRTFDWNGTSSESAELVCEGLDTLATVKLNGQSVLDANNMYREWRVDVSKALVAGSNTIEVTFHPVLDLLAEGREKRNLREWNIYFDRHSNRGYVRKMACSFGWDWGPVAPTFGIWKGVRLEQTKGARWTDFRVNQQHANGAVTLEIDWATSGSGQVAIELLQDGKCVAKAEADASAGHAKIEVENPNLWWPAGQGEQPLYTVRAVLTDANGRQDEVSRRIGLRSLRLVRERDEIGESFTFEINGRPIFMKGANWVPHRIYLPSVERHDLARLLGDAVECNMNMIRVWGGGIYESEDFYDLCDELGILIWQDFMFACGTYPTWDSEFLKNVEGEARDNIRRLRHRPSLALLCGNNEIEQTLAGNDHYTWEEYGALFDKLLPALCSELAPQTPYWPGSPHTPVGKREDFNNDESGDTHHWSVFFGRQPFESQRKWRCRFMSEYGFQSFPELRTVESFTDPADRGFMSRIMDYRQRSEVGNQTILSYLVDWFQIPPSFEDVLILSQVSQSLCVRYAAEHLRRIQPRCAGVLYWQLNDIWPCPSWSSIDSFGRWKVLQYEARRFFAPILVSIEEDLKTSSFRIHVSNQAPTESAVEWQWEVTDTDGNVLSGNQGTIQLAAQHGDYVDDGDATAHLEVRHAHDLMIWAWASVDGEVVSRNWAPLSRPKHLSIADPGITTEVSGNEVRIQSARPAAYVRLSLDSDDAIFDDNYFHLYPGEQRVVRIQRGPATISTDDLRVTSLADWMPARPANAPLEDRPPGYDLQRKRMTY